MVLPRRGDLAGRYHGQHGVVDVQSAAEQLAQAGLTALGERADADREVHAGRAGLLRDPGGLLGGVAVAHHQPGADPAQRRVQVGEAAGEEGPPVGGGEARGLDRSIHHEHRDDLVGGGAGGVQDGVVVQAEVLGEQGDGDGHRGPRSW